MVGNSNRLRGLMAQNGYQIVEEVPLEGLPTPGTQEAALYALHTAVTDRAVMWSLDPTRDVAAFLNAYAKVLAGGLINRASAAQPWRRFLEGWWGQEHGPRSRLLRQGDQTFTFLEKAKFLLILLEPVQYNGV